MNKLNNEQLAYLAGFLDADGSLVAQFKSNQQYKTKYQIAITVQISQLKSRRFLLNQFQKEIGMGYVRDRPGNSEMSDYVITAVGCIKEFLIAIKPFIRLKKGQLNSILRIIELMPNATKTKQNFEEIATLVDKVAKANNSKNLIHTGDSVMSSLIESNFFENLVPVETSDPNTEF